MVLLLFVAGLAMIGLGHQTVWLFAAKEPLTVNSFYSSRRAYISEGFALGAAAKIAVSEFLLENGKAPNNDAQVGIDPADKISSPGVESVSVGEGGVITIRYHEIIEGGDVVKFIPSLRSVVEWSCSSTYPSELLPAMCPP